jgi:hypothetical protein
MTIREHILEVAAGQIGYTEEPKNSNLTKYGAWFGLNGKAWCGQFVSWCFFTAGVPLGVIDYKKGFAGCQYATRNLKKWGRLVTVPMAGDVVFYDWQGDGVFDHTGIFVKDLGKGLFEAIEGNTAFGNDSNGGAVMRRADRRYKSAIFCRPKCLEPLI